MVGRDKGKGGRGGGREADREMGEGGGGSIGRWGRRKTEGK